MKKHGRGKAQGVYPVEQAAGTSDRLAFAAPVGDAAVALEGFHHQVAQRAGHTGDQCHGHGLARLEGGQSRHQATHKTAHCQAYEPAAPMKGLADLGRCGRFGPASRRQVLHQHAGLHHKHQKENQKGVFSAVAREVQQQQGRHMAHAVDADHDAPLQFGIALQKTLRVIGQCANHRYCQKHVHRDKHRDQVEALSDHQPELGR